MLNPLSGSLLLSTLLMLILGTAVIASSHMPSAIQQIIAAIGGLILFFLIKSFDYRALKGLVKISYIAVFLLLIITLILGFESRGSVRWISLGFFNLQPSELAKPVLILALAAFWAKRVPNWTNIFKSFLILLPLFFCVFRQPDLGTALTLFFIWGSILFAANLSFWKILLMGGTGLTLLPISWNFLQEYQKHRIISFLSPTQDPQGIGFHVIQSMIAVGSGEMFGRGLGRGTQSRLQFLPEFRTDFIFAFISEELGFIGALAVLVLYGTILFLCLKILSNAKDKFGELLIVGVMSMILFQTTVNIGMNVGLLPITGITLPLLSYGGSSIVVTLASLGLVASVATFGQKRNEYKSAAVESFQFLKD